MSERKHNGNLGKHEVSFWPESSPEFVCIEEADGWHDEPDFVQLTAEQALSLLAWLKENKPALEKMAEEKAKKMNKDQYGRYVMHCSGCGQVVLVSFKWLYEVGHCLKWYGCYLPDSPEGWVEHCPGCGIEFGYPPPLQEYSSLLVKPSVLPEEDAE